MLEVSATNWSIRNAEWSFAAQIYIAADNIDEIVPENSKTERISWNKTQYINLSRKVCRQFKTGRKMHISKYLSNSLLLSNKFDILNRAQVWENTTWSLSKYTRLHICIREYIIKLHPNISPKLHPQFENLL